MASLTSNLLSQLRSDVQTDLNVLFTYGAVGTGTPSGTALGSELLRKTVTNDITTFADKFISSLEISSTEGNGSVISEGGYFNSSSGGTMWQSDSLNSISKTSDINLFVESEITISVTEE